MQNLEFGVFVTLWNQTQGYVTPALHYKMAEWLQKSWEKGDKQLLLMAFRASGKSTITALFCTWLLWRDSNLRILVLSAEENLASKMVRNIKHIIEKHPLTFDMKPNKAEQWASDRFTVNRSREARDPSVLSAGIFSNITGNRADIIIYDDVEVPNTCDTYSKRLQLREKLLEGNFILVPGGTHLYIGTPHNYFSIYAKKLRKEINEKEIFLKNYKRLSIPVLDKDYKSAWSENYSLDDIELIRGQVGPNKFSSQMMLEPVNFSKGRLNSELLKHYSEILHYSEVQREISLSIRDRKLVSCSAWWDPSFGKENNDGSVLAIIYTDEEGNYYLHHLEYINIENNKDDDEATAQCKIVAELLKRFYVPSVTIEINGIGKFLPAILRRELANKRVTCAVVEYSNRQAKNIRILEAFDAVLAAQALYVHSNVQDTNFITEMMEWRPDVTNGNDDGLDAVAGAISLEPVRIKRSYFSDRHSWQQANKGFQADSNFDV